MIKTKKWSLLKYSPKRISGLLGLNLLSNIPRAMLSGFLYIFIIQLALPKLNHAGVEFSVLWEYFWYYCLIFVIYLVLSVLSQTNSFVQAYSVSSDLRIDIGNKLHKLSLGFFKQHDPGDVTSRILHDVNKAEETLSHSIPDIIAAFIVPIILGAFLATINLILSAVLAGSVLLAWVFLMIGRKIVATIGEHHTKAITDTSSRILEYAGSLKLLKAYNLTGEHFSTMKEAMKRLKRESFRVEVFAGIPVQVFLLVLDMGYLLVLGLGAWLCFENSLRLEYYFTYAILSYFFYRPIKVLGPKLLLLRYANLSKERIADVFKTEEPGFKHKERLNGRYDIEFLDVSFRYKSEDVIKNLNCCIPEKSMSALVGPSGAGKTTITSLIARFWDVSAGEIRIGGKNIKDLAPDKLLSKISMVFQDVYLFNDTIAANIRIGKQGATDEEVYNAAKLAACHDFISALPNGYNTMVGEGGNTLSGGEKQRISIARAILKDAPIILLDEATASLDPENEADIQHAIENLIRNKTVVVIAHRFRTIVNADQILVFDNGKLIDKGTHESLISKEGLYKMLWEKQNKARGWKIEAGK